MGPQRLRIYLDGVFDLLSIAVKLFDQVFVFWVGGPVSGRRSTDPVRIRTITNTLWASDICTRGHLRVGGVGARGGEENESKLRGVVTHPDDDRVRNSPIIL